jgi:serine/threonine protein kinase
MGPVAMNQRRRKHPPQSESREQTRLHGGGDEELKLFSQRDRGRGLIRDFRPPPKGTRRLAIIVPFDEACQQLRRRLRRLPDHASSLPTLIDHGWLDSQYCFIVERILGIDLERYLERLGFGRAVQPSVTQCLRLFRGTVHSLRLMHDVSQLVHGDLKPANLVLTTHPSQLCLIDFGISWQWAMLEMFVFRRVIARSNLRGQTATVPRRPSRMTSRTGLRDATSGRFSLGEAPVEGDCLRFFMADLGRNGSESLSLDAN